MDGSVDVQFCCVNGHSGWLTLWLEENHGHREVTKNQKEVRG